MMRISIMQPAYLPWCGYMQRIMLSDLHVVLDHVKIDENNKTKFTNRNRILTQNGPDWLTIPYLKASSPGLIINELRIDDGKHWRRKHWDKIRHNYQRAPFFQEHAAFLGEFFARPHELLTQAVEESTQYLLHAVDCATPRIKSSALSGLRSKSELNLDICLAVGATSYLAGPFSRDYLDLSLFERNGITVEYHDFHPVPYAQGQPGFTPCLSVLDLLLNVGGREARRVLETLG